ncbi:hypothetical protein ACCO45_012312 [Purpureocillium lilacinum]|uniref:Uncharacterized protein n=1 Tax=Purpureocillium lilacinum TaxID=33203 RepID=A0ACC4D7V9_PURLI
MAAVSPRDDAPTQQLAIKDVFEALSPREKLYAHHLARAAWNGSRIILRQTSPEGTGIFDFIIELHKACGGQWDSFVEVQGVNPDDLTAFLEFAGLFLSGLGNYFASDRKVVPPVSADSLLKMASSSPGAAAALEEVIDPMLSTLPSSLGFPDENNQSNYYPGQGQITKDEIAEIARVMEANSIEPENTRIRKHSVGQCLSFDILQASAEAAVRTLKFDDGKTEGIIRLESGDHAAEMSKICFHLNEAAKHVSNTAQAEFLANCIECFRTGDLEAYRVAQRAWVADISPRVETILGFVEPYRDPYGVRAEWEGVVCFSDPGETEKLKTLVDEATKFIRMLPWATPGENDGKGPFEANLFQAPDFTIVHSLAFCSSYVWEAVNLPNYSDIRETCGSKNIVFANRMSLNSSRNRPCYFVRAEEVKEFRAYNHIIRFVVTAIHELLGHGTGKLLTEVSAGKYNFDREKMPINPLTDRPVETWYRPGQTWTSVFEKLATSVEECRAMLVSYYLADNKDVLSVFGYNDMSAISADDLIYYTYLHVGVEGIQALRAFNVRDMTWGQPHARANFAILKHLLLDGGGVIIVKCDEDAETVQVSVDRSKISSHGKPSLGRMLLRIHIWRCIADVESCRDFYEPLSVVDGGYEIWRRIVASKPEPWWKFVQPNTVVKDDGEVELVIYEESNKGIIQQTAEYVAPAGGSLENGLVYSTVGYEGVVDIDWRVTPEEPTFGGANLRRSQPSEEPTFGGANLRRSQPSEEPTFGGANMGRLVHQLSDSVPSTLPFHKSTSR